MAAVNQTGASPNVAAPQAKPAQKAVENQGFSSPEELKQAQEWNRANGFNQYGDPADTIYIGGNPLFDPKTAQKIPLSDYMKANYPDSPWKHPEWKGFPTEKEHAQAQQWIKENNLNQYGDPKDVVYAGGNPLFDMKTAEKISLANYLNQQHPEAPWRSVSVEPAPAPEAVADPGASGRAAKQTQQELVDASLKEAEQTPNPFNKA